MTAKEFIGTFRSRTPGLFKFSLWFLGLSLTLALVHAWSYHTKHNSDGWSEAAFATLNTLIGNTLDKADAPSELRAVNMALAVVGWLWIPTLVGVLLGIAKDRIDAKIEREERIMAKYRDSIKAILAEAEKHGIQVDPHTLMALLDQLERVV